MLDQRSAPLAAANPDWTGGDASGPPGPSSSSPPSSPPRRAQAGRTSTSCRTTTLAGTPRTWFPQRWRAPPPRTSGCSSFWAATGAAGAKVLENEIDQSEELIDLLDRNYVVAKVYCDAGSPGIRFKPRKQPRYGASFVSIRAKAYPHIVILDSDGKRLLSRDMGGMVKKGRYSEKKPLRLLNRHK